MIEVIHSLFCVHFASLVRNQERRFADPAMVDKVVKSDEEWRKGRKAT